MFWKKKYVRSEWVNGVLFAEEMAKTGCDLFKTLEVMGCDKIILVDEKTRAITFEPTGFHFGIKDYFEHYEKYLK